MPSGHKKKVCQVGIRSMPSGHTAVPSGHIAVPSGHIAVPSGHRKRAEWAYSCAEWALQQQCAKRAPPGDRPKGLASHAVLGKIEGSPW